MAARAPLDKDERALRLQLMEAIDNERAQRCLNITEAAGLLGVRRPEYSYLVNQHVDRLSLSKLLSWARTMGVNYKLSLEISSPPQ
ncbi:XRE family transcriptional regulator [Nocardia ninae]|uniref:HigA2-like helix-turn-helix domain-containing protein n=1 Tax=Nocardia ninae NBRC 108245 TaxID=1210091 RepID=A0A511MGW2_9NOCA|nr:XRE family transcriptional regulator [Nocardia ninae]GEM39910.1 hypothetical protein NN4_44290 [Nocardia ninae NBRC 108245]